MKNTWRIGPPARSGVPRGGLAGFDGRTWADAVAVNARIRRSRTTTQVGVSHAMLSVLVTHRARDSLFCSDTGPIVIKK